MLLDPYLNFAPQHITTIHIMGICGTGMAALAGMLKQSGYTVTGSDSHVYPPMSDFLKQIGIIPFDSYSKDNLTYKPDLIIVGNVITSNNPEAVALATSTIPYLSFPQALASFFITPRTSIVVAGTHGKTTTCSILASALYHANLDPSFMIGGIVSEFQSNNRIGEGDYFIAEGDEYDTAFFDKESKFLHYQPKIAIITSVEFDHADIFTDLEHIKASFRKFVSLLPSNGLIIAHLDDKNVAEVVENAQCHVEGYGMNSINYWHLEDCKTFGNGSTFTFKTEGSKSQTLHIPLSGKHNCLNSLAVTAVMNHINITLPEIGRCLDKFGGVKRRQEVRGIKNGVTVIDDFAHHPTAVYETLKGLKDKYAKNRIIAVFEPRTNSSRRSFFQQRYIESFEAADVILIREPLPLNNVALEDHFSSAKLAEDLQAINRDAKSFGTTDDILDHLLTVVHRGDVVAILSNGGFDNIHERLLVRLGSLSNSDIKSTTH